MPTVAGRQVRRLVALARQRGLDPDPLLAAAGLDERELTADTRVPLAQSDALLEALAGAAGEVGLGLQLAFTHEPDTYDAAGLVLMASATLRSGLERAFTYQRLWGDGDRFSLQPTPAGLAVRFTPVGAPRPAHRIVAQCALAELVLGARFLLGREVTPLSAQLTSGAGDDVSDLAGFLGVVPARATPANQVELALADVDAPLQNANQMFQALFESMARRAVEALPPPMPPLSLRVRQLLVQALAGGDAGLTAIARTLRLAPRTLQRRLADEGTSHAALRDQARADLARALLGKGLPVVEVSSLVGYADETAFFRAFRKWTGTTPQRYREQSHH